MIDSRALKKELREPHWWKFSALGWKHRDIICWSEDYYPVPLPALLDASDNEVYKKAYQQVSDAFFELGGDSATDCVHAAIALFAAVQVHCRDGVIPSGHSPALGLVVGEIAPPKKDDIHDRDHLAPKARWEGHMYMIVCYDAGKWCYFDPFTLRIFKISRREEKTISRMVFA